MSDPVTGGLWDSPWRHGRAAVFILNIEKSKKEVTDKMQKPKLTRTFLLTLAGLLSLAMGTPANAADDGSASCSLNSLKGAYGYSFSGTVSPWGPLAGQGTIVFGGSGTLTGAYIENVNGLVFQGKFTGTFTVAPDCTGSATMTGLLKTWMTQLHFVIVNEGKDVLLVDTDSGKVVSGSAKKL